MQVCRDNETPALSLMVLLSDYRTVLKYYYDDTEQLVCQRSPAEIENTTV
jgi:hypothetical protein